MKDPRSIVAAKRDGRSLSQADVRAFVEGYTKGEVSDALAAAFLMACLLRGLDDDETLALTKAMVDSGDTLRFSGDASDAALPPTVDKHSTGGVADGVTLVFAPLAAALGLAVAKLSGRGLGHTGGTLDKLESIPGFRTDLSPEEIRRQVATSGCAVAAQTATLVPADGALYALRDATATVPSIPLIAASVMSKKLAVETDLILLDVKAGSGAFMKSPEDARALAERCLALAAGWGRKASAAVTDMSQPLGDAVGNALDVAETVALLRGETGGRLREAALLFAARALELTNGTDHDRRSRRRPPRSSRGSASSGSGRWSRRRAAILGWSTTPRASSRPLPFASRCSPIGAAPWRPSRPRRSASRAWTWEPAGCGRAIRSTRPSVSWCIRRSATGWRPGRPSGRCTREIARPRRRPGAASSRRWTSSTVRSSLRRSSTRGCDSGGDGMGNFSVLGLKLAAYMLASLFVGMTLREYTRARAVAGSATPPRACGAASRSGRSSGSSRSGAASSRR